MIRIRRVPPGLLQRRRYEVEFTPRGGAVPEWTKTTTTPVTLIDKHIGVGEAWSVVRAADAAWRGDVGEWVTFPPTQSGSQ